MLRLGTIALAVAALLLAGTGLARAGLLANWTLNDLGAVGSTGTPGVTTFADLSGYGRTGTLSGADSLTSIAGIIGTGASFGGAAVTTNYITVPDTTNLGGMNNLTLSAWVNIPAAAKVASDRMVFNMWDTGTQVYEFGTKYSTLATARGLYARSGTSGTDYILNKSFWDRTDGSGFVADTWELLTFVWYGGTSDTAGAFVQMYVNGMLIRNGNWGGAAGNGIVPVGSPAPGQAMRIGVGTREWQGGLNDLGIWNTDLTGPYAPNDLSWVSGSKGGQISAMYNTPMYNGHTGALSQYGVKVMDQLFNIYNAAGGQTTVTTSNGTLTWQYVASGLGGTSGSPGYIAGTGQYFIQLDANGGGVITVVPEPGTLALLAAGLAGLLAYAWRKRK